jgi:hypothetical protein
VTTAARNAVLPIFFGHIDRQSPTIAVASSVCPGLARSNWPSDHNRIAPLVGIAGIPMAGLVSNEMIDPGEFGPKYPLAHGSKGLPIVAAQRPPP